MLICAALDVVHAVVTPEAVGLGEGEAAELATAVGEAVGEAVAPAVGEAVAPAVGEDVAPAVGDDVAPADGDAVAPADGDAVAPIDATALGEVLAIGLGPFDVDVGLALGATVAPDGTGVGLSGLFPVTLPPPDAHAVTARAVQPTNTPSIKRLCIEDLQ